MPTRSSGSASFGASSLKIALPGEPRRMAALAAGHCSARRRTGARVRASGRPSSRTPRHAAGASSPCRGHPPLEDSLGGADPVRPLPDPSLFRDSGRPPYREPTPRKRRTPREAPCIGASVDGVTTEGQREPFGTRRRVRIRWSTKDIGTAWQARYRWRPVDAAPWGQLDRFRRPAPDGLPTPAAHPGWPELAWRDIDQPRFTANLVPMPSLPRDNDPRDPPWRRLRGRDRWKNPSP